MDLFVHQCDLSGNYASSGWPQTWGPPNDAQFTDGLGISNFYTVGTGTTYIYVVGYGIKYSNDYHRVDSMMLKYLQNGGSPQQVSWYGYSLYDTFTSVAVESNVNLNPGIYICGYTEFRRAPLVDKTGI
jgi:hypothetical protein